MATQSIDSGVVGQLQTKQGKLLDDIDQLRAQGIGRYVELPQLIVCGDQSSGKSSVLEAISRVRFPIKESTCTRFATELILRRAATTRVSVSIVPGPTRSVEEKERLSNFNGKFSGADEMPRLIDEARAAMGLSLDGPSSSFSDDVLRVEISGPDQPHLTVVDLPGLTHSVDDSQKHNEVNLVYNLVQSYMANSRSIILAVVSAQYDMENQIVRTLVKAHDPQGARTLGIITKPDTLDQGSEQEAKFLELAKNTRTSLRLGWHVLKNRDYGSRDASDEARDEAEEAFLSKGIWTELGRSQVGIKPLRKRLSEVLLNQVSENLPALIREIEKGVIECTSRLEKLGDPRQTSEGQRKYLTTISDAFQRLVIAAVEGNYNDTGFFADGIISHSRRAKHLRSMIHVLIQNFAKEMREKGHRRRVAPPLFSTWNFQQDHLMGPLDIFASGGAESASVTRATLTAEVTERAKMIRGKELDGFPNALLIGELFRDQSQPWEEIASRHIKLVGRAVESCLSLILNHVTNEETYNAILHEIILPSLEQRQASAQQMLQLLLKHHKRGHTITYDPDFVHGDQTNLAAGNKVADVQPNAASTASKEETTDTHGSDRIIDGMASYYRIALRNIIDNFAVLAVENCLMDGLPAIFSSTLVSTMDSSTLSLLAAESEDVQRDRNILHKKLDVLKLGLRTCNRYVRNPTGQEHPLKTEKPGIDQTSEPGLQPIPKSNVFDLSSVDAAFKSNFVLGFPETPTSTNKTSDGIGSSPLAKCAPSSSSKNNNSFNDGEIKRSIPSQASQAWKRTSSELSGKSDWHRFLGSGATKESTPQRPLPAFTNSTTQRPSESGGSPSQHRSIASSSEQSPGSSGTKDR